MKNREKYIDEIIDTLFREGECEFMKRHNLTDVDMFGKCYSAQDCSECLARLKNWLEEEYQEPIILSEDEKTILRNIDKKYKWIVRDPDYRLGVFECEPYKDNYWIDNGGDYTALDVFNHLFQFIKSLDKAYRIDELLGISGAEGTE